VAPVIIESIDVLAFQDPIIVKIIEPPGKLETLGNVIMGAVGLSGLLALLAVVFGAAVGALVFWFRSRRA
jgi:hypothetical protein